MRLNITLKSDFYTQGVVLTRMSVIITLRVETTLVRVDIIVVSVVITFVHVKITLRMEITLICVRISIDISHKFKFNTNLPNFRIINQHSKIPTS
jgi:hypothetical protein